MVRRSAFTFIELIFAIVIIAITVVSLPMMNQAVSKGIDENLVQEAIFAAATELNEAVTAHWDDHSFESGIFTAYARVIDHNGDCDATTRLMPGHINQKLHRRCLDDATVTPADSDTNTSIVSLDDMEHTSQSLFLNDTTSQSGYKKSYNSILSVHRGALFAGGINNNIKSIEINVTTDSKTIVSLKTYSANIGGIDYYKRTY